MYWLVLHGAVVWQAALAAVDARAEQLEVVLEDGPVRVEGPVTVVVGAREAWPKRRLEHLPPRDLGRAGLTATAWVSARPAVFRAIFESLSLELRTPGRR